MQTKTKAIMAALLILIITIAVVSYSFSKRQKQNKNVDDVSLVAQTEQQKIATDTERERAANVKPVQVTKVGNGLVTSINGNILSVKTNEDEIAVNITDATVFYVMENGLPIMKNKDDLKQGIEIMVEYEENSKDALSINIIQK